MKNFGGKPVKILVVRFSSIGDIVLTSPVIRCLNEQLPNCTIHYLTKRKYSDLVQNNPSISHIYTIEKSIREILPILKEERYDLIIDLHKNIRSFILKISLLRPHITFKKLNFRKLLAVRLKINILPPVHIVDRMMKPLAPFGIFYDGKGLDYYLSDDTHLPKDMQRFCSAHPHYFVFAIGGTYFTKRLPNEKVIAICKKINHPVIFIGGMEDTTNADIIAGELGSLCFNSCGKTNIDQSTLLIKNSVFVISNDTGMMHIAAAMKKPVISLWGNTIPQFGMSPLLPCEFEPAPLIAQVNGLRCRPCSKLGYQHCPKKHFNCMNLISHDEILNYIHSLNLISRNNH